MHAEIAEFRDRCATLAQHRQISVGTALDLSRLTTWPADVQDQASFTTLVSAAYQLWRENWKLDVRFLMDRRPQGTARDFDRLINQLRTSQQHADSSGADAAAGQWARTVCGDREPETSEDWLACGIALMVALNDAIGVLCRTVTQHQSQDFRAAWQAKVGVSEEAVVLRVAADLGLRLHKSQVGSHVSRVKGRWAGYRLKPGEVADNILASYAEQSLISRYESLPCSYLDVLGELGVLGTREAVHALHLAHAVAEITHASGEPYMKRLKDVWVLLCS
jgi:hypothetical protein